jgi:small-conductance mechanosensitive channel
VSMLEELLSYLPNLLAAGLVLLVGWFIARIAQRLTTSFLSAAGLDRLSDRVGLTSVMGSQTLSGVLGLIVFYLIIIPTFVAALNALGIQALTLPAANMLNIALGAIPNIIAAAVLLAIAYVVARLVAGLITNVLTALGFNGILVPLGLGEVPREGERTPSEIVGYLALVLIMFFAAIEGLALLGFEAVAVLLSGFLVFAAKVILGLIIFAIGLYLANLAAKVIKSSKIAQAGLLALAARIAILVLAAAMALRQMGLANEIINLAFGLTLGAIAVAVALAFGLGGREMAAKELESWRRSLEEES